MLFSQSATSISILGVRVNSLAASDSSGTAASESTVLRSQFLRQQLIAKYIPEMLMTLFGELRTLPVEWIGEIRVLVAVHQAKLNLQDHMMEWLEIKFHLTRCAN